MSGSSRSKPRSVSDGVPMSNAHVSESNNWHDRLVEEDEGHGLQAHAHILECGFVPAKIQLERWGVRVVMVGKPGVGRNMVLCCACVFVCVWQLQPSCPWQCCCNQANQGRLPAFFTPLGSLPAAHRHAHAHTQVQRSFIVFRLNFLQH